jgi:hypothetical protein
MALLSKSRQQRDFEWPMERAAIVSGQTLLVLVLGEWIGNNSLELYNVLVGH